MDWITDTLAIGGLRDAGDFPLLAEEGIEAVLQLCGREREQLIIPLPLDHLRLPVDDRRPLPPSVLTQGVKFLRRHQLAGHRTLVCCGAEMSRSPVFLAAYLYESGTDLLKALRLIRSRRPIVRPHRALVRCLVEHYGLKMPAEELLQELLRG